MGKARRRQLLIVAGALLSAPSLFAQTAAKKFRVGWIIAAARPTDIPALESTHAGFRALLQELRSRGYVRGVNLEFDIVTAEGKPDNFPELAAAIVRRNPDVIMAAGSQPSMAARNATSTIPIVMMGAADPVKYGLIASLAHPRGNVTGITADVSPEIEVKRLVYLKQAMPRLARVTCMATKWVWDGPMGQELRRSSKATGLQIEYAEFTPTDLEASLRRVKAQRPEALFVVLSPEVYSWRKEIVEFALNSRLPATVPYADMTKAGALMSYGFDVASLFRTGARYIDKIFKGAKPAELPVEQPSRFELVLNLRTARTLGLNLPESLIAQADRVIE